MKCCHGHALTADDDPRFAEDDFTQAAVREHRARATHAHAGALVLTLIGALLFFGAMKSVHRRIR